MTSTRIGPRSRHVAYVALVVVIAVATSTAAGCRRQDQRLDTRQDHLPAKAIPARALPPAAAMQPAEPALAPAAIPSPPLAESAAASDFGTTLLQDERDNNPRSETVTIKILAEPRRQAHVFWGRKDLGLAPLEVQRPRNSGPLELLVLAPNCLPLHTRVFTDRDDKLWLRLYSKEEAPQVLGYRLEPPAPAARPR
jgi:hypothetical protein